MPRPVLIALCLLAAGCGDESFETEAVLLDTERVAPGLVRITYTDDFHTEIVRVDLRLIGRDRAAVQVRLREAGDGPGIAITYCVDVTVPDDVARRRLVEPDGEPIRPLSDGDAVDAGGVDCARVRGSLVDRFAPDEA